jgi:hypothetical protein
MLCLTDNVPLQLSTRSDQNISRLNSILTPWNKSLISEPNSSSVSLEISQILYILQVHYRIYRSPSLLCICASPAILIRFISTISLCISLLSRECCVLCPSHHSGFDEESRSSGSSLCPFRSGYFPQLPIIRHPQTMLFA